MKLKLFFYNLDKLCNVVKRDININKLKYEVQSTDFIDDFESPDHDLYLDYEPYKNRYVIVYECPDDDYKWHNKITQQEMIKSILFDYKREIIHEIIIFFNFEIAKYTNKKSELINDLVDEYVKTSYTLHDIIKNNKEEN